MKNAKGDEVGWFCVCCFADERGGSWGEGTIPNAGFCANCGAASCLVPIPLWGIDSIRKNASWVGKRYYPTEEDGETRAELNRLRCTLDPFKCPGRTVREWTDAEGKVIQMVEQRLPDGRSVSMFTEERLSHEAALAWAATRLPFYTEESLRKDAS